MMYPFSLTQWIAGDEPVEATLQKLKACGYDGIELDAEPGQDLPAIKAALVKSGLCCTSLCGKYTKERDLSSDDAGIRASSQQYLRDSIDMAALMGAKLLIVVPTYIGKTAPEKSYDSCWNHAKQGILAVADYARQQGVLLVMEPINRYETFLMPTIALTRKFVEEVNHPAVKMMADLFHMNLEERSLEESLRLAAPYLAHIHIADNTREPAGFGSTDFKTAFRVLQSIGYQGAVAMEFLPPTGGPAGLMEQWMKQSVDYIRQMVHTLEQAQA